MFEKDNNYHFTLKQKRPKFKLVDFFIFNGSLLNNLRPLDNKQYMILYCPSQIVNISVFILYINEWY